VPGRDGLVPGREPMAPGREPGAGAREPGPLGGSGRRAPGGGGIGRPEIDRGPGGGGIGLPAGLTGGLLAFASFASLGLPALSGFVGEFLSLLGSWESRVAAS